LGVHPGLKRPTSTLIGLLLPAKLAKLPTRSTDPTNRSIVRQTRFQAPLTPSLRSEMRGAFWDKSLIPPHTLFQLSYRLPMHPTVLTRSIFSKATSPTTSDEHRSTYRGVLDDNCPAPKGLRCADFFNSIIECDFLPFLHRWRSSQ
uniref:BPTI/Kunitz inhibitor domain-containing protein n=1 Tax=Heligmosomoides polygyrus TaxID=6339 RepID=A0A183G4U5_HELPZ